MRQRITSFLLIVSCLPVLVGCSTFITGKKHADQATQAVLADLEPDQAREAAMRYENLHEHFGNFGVVNAVVYRSAQPDLDQLWRLRNAAFASVVNFRKSEEDVAREAATCAELGLTYYSLPWDGHNEEIDPGLVSQFLEILDDPANLPVLVHCERGAERTGTLIAVYRIEHDGWDADEAYEEMLRYKFRPIWFGHLKRFVLEYETPSSSRQGGTRHR